VIRHRHCIGRVLLLLVFIGGLASISFGRAHATVATTAEREAESFARRLFGLSAQEGRYWEFKNVSSFGARAMASYMPLPIPGKVPEVAQFLEKTGYFGSLQTMEKAWGRPLLEFPFAPNVDSYLSSKSGKTVVLIGHIEGDAFVFSKSPGAARLTIASLQDSAKQYNVFLIPIGCQSDSAGALIGTTRNITTDEVANVLRSLPKRDQTLSEFLDSFKSLGSLTMDVEKANDMLLFTVVDPFGRIMASFRIPAQAMGSRALSSARLFEALSNPFEALEWLTSSVLSFSVALFGLGTALGVLFLLHRTGIIHSERILTALFLLCFFCAILLAVAVAMRLYIVHDRFESDRLLTQPWISPTEIKPRSWRDNFVDEFKDALAFHYSELVGGLAGCFYVSAILLLCLRRSLGKVISRSIGWLLRIIYAIELGFLALAMCFGGLFFLAGMADRTSSIWWQILTTSSVPACVWLYEQLSEREGQNAAALPTSEEGTAG
jgi:hypothetical protein